MSLWDKRSNTEPVWLHLLLITEDPYDHREGHEVWGDPDEIVSVVALWDKRRRESLQRNQQRSLLTNTPPEDYTRLWLRRNSCFRVKKKCVSVCPIILCSLKACWVEVCRWAPLHFSASLPSSLAEPSSVFVLSPAALPDLVWVQECVCLCVFCECVCCQIRKDNYLPWARWGKAPFGELGEHQRTQRAPRCTTVWSKARAHLPGTRSHSRYWPDTPWGEQIYTTRQHNLFTAELPRHCSPITDSTIAYFTDNKS